MTATSHVRAWLAAIGETDPTVLERIEADPSALAYFAARATENNPRPSQTEPDRAPINQSGESEMSLTITETTSVNFTPCPAGTYPARCILVADLGTQESDYQGETKRAQKLLLQFEVCDTDTRRDDGEAFILSKRYTASLHEKASLRKDLASWRGRDFTPDELAGFNVKSILGKPCLVSVTHQAKADRTYANVNSIMAVPKGMPCPPQSAELIWFDLSDPDPVAFDKLPQRVQEQIRLSPEFKTARFKSAASPEADDLGDDIPF